VTPYGYAESDLLQRLQAPSLAHPFGTDELGRDVLSRVAEGGRVSLGVGVGAMVVALSVATIIGVVGGYFGRAVDTGLQRLVDSVMSFPTLLIALTVAGIFGSSMPMLMLLIGMLLGISQSRIVRSRALSLRQELYVEGARAVGASDLRIILRHVVPNTIPVLIVLSSFTVSSAIIIEASLSFLGLGVPPPRPSWGGMLSGSGLQFMILAPWIGLFPGIVLSIVVFSANIVGDAVRDVIDPRMRGS
jgi:peptide/nickel transport system permease protein